MPRRGGVGSMLLLLLPAALSLAFEHLQVTGRAIEKGGGTIIAYCGLRVALAVTLIGSCVASGLVVRRIVLGEQPAAQFEIQRLICTFALGAVALALVMLLLGFAGLLYRPTAWIVCGLALAAGAFIVQPAPRFSAGEGAPARAIVPAAALWLLVALNVAAALFLLAHRALFPSEIDGDVWEHYLHYFHEVTAESHHLWPGELWIHFFTSKAATLQILAVLLSDVLAPHVVSWCFVVFAAVVAYDLTRTLTNSAQWGLVSSLGTLAAAGVLYAVPNFLKHHIVFAGLVVFIAWYVVRSVAEREVDSRGRLAAGAAVAFYIGLYLPVGGAIVILGLVLAALVAAAIRREAVLQIAAAGAAASVGILCALALNYATTGLALDAPAALFWRFADQARFARLWDPLVLEYWFLGAGASEGSSPPLAQAIVPNPGWLAEVLRLRYVRSLGWLVALAGTAGCVFWLLRRQAAVRPDAGRLAGIASLVAFLLGTLILANVFPSSDSVYRLYAFSFFLVVVVGVVLIGVLSAPALPTPFRQSIFALLVAVALLHTLWGAVPRDRIRLVKSYLKGQLSMRDVLTLNDRYAADLPGGFANFLEAKRAVKDGRILYMGFSPSPGYLLPSPPLLSEPSYAFGDRYGEILYGGAERAEAALKTQGIDYFLINARSRLFLGIPYSELFEASRISRRLGLHWSNGEFYLLTWNSPATRVLPPEFISMLEFKQRSIFAKLKAELAANLATDSGSITDPRALEILETYLLQRLHSKEARDLVARFLRGEAERHRLQASAQPTAEVANRLALALRDFAAEQWGEPIAREMWNLRLSEDIQSQDFGWLYERNRARYSSRQQSKDAR